MAWVPAQDDMAWKRASTGRGSMPPQITSFEPHARPPDSFRKPCQGDLILFSQISSIRNEGRHEAFTRTYWNNSPTNLSIRSDTQSYWQSMLVQLGQSHQCRLRVR